MSKIKTALSICAHPDDAEFYCTGALALMHQMGWHIEIATLTAGDCGSMEMSRAQTALVRKNEGASAAAILEGTYHCLDFDDVFVMYDRPTLLQAIALIRKIQPEIVFAPSPHDYSSDHEMTSLLVRTACFSSAIPNVETPGYGATEKVPYLYYLDPLYGKDNFGKNIIPQFLIDITTVMQFKEQMLACHKSQRDWLKAHHGWDEYIEIMKRHCSCRGQQCGSQFAEGFRQHLGNGFPQNNILVKELTRFVRPCA